MEAARHQAGQYRTAKEQRGFRIRSQPDHHWRPSQPGPGLRSRGDPGVARLARRGRRRAGPGTCPLSHAPAHRARPREARRRTGDAQHGLRQHHRHQGRAVLPRQRGDRAQGPERDPLERGGDGLPRPAARASASAATSPPSPPLPPCTTWASTTSSAARTRATAATRSSSRATPPPGIYARAFLLDRLTEPQLDGFRQEKSKAPHGLSSYPHPRSMPDFWEFPTVSMGLGPDRRDLPGADEPLHGGPRHRRHLQVARVGVPRRR